MKWTAPVEVIETGLSFPSAITFDKMGNLWVLENNNIALPGHPPTVRVFPNLNGHFFRN